MEVPKCTSCKRRQAFYYRRQSGELLCKICLERSVIKQIKRAIGRFNLLQPRSTIIIPLIPDMPYESLITAVLISIIERKYLSKVMVLPLFKLPRQTLEVLKLRAKPTDIIDGYDDLMESWIRGCSFSDYLDALTRNIIQITEELNPNAIVLPTTRNDILRIFLYFLTRGDRVGASTYTKPLIKLNNVNFIQPLYYVIRTDIRALIIKYRELLSDLEVPNVEFSDLRALRLIDDLIIRLGLENSELLYSFDKALEFLHTATLRT